MYKLRLHKYAQCGFDSYTSENHERVFYSYQMPIYSIFKESYGSTTTFRIKSFNSPNCSVTTARQTTWSLNEELLNNDCSRYVRKLLQACYYDMKIYVIRDMSVGVWCVFIGDKLMRTFKE